MDSSYPEGIADHRNFEGEILRRLAMVKNDEVANACGREASWVSKLVAGDTGLRLNQLQPFLDALGLKLVPKDEVSVRLEVLGAYKTLAREALNGPAAR